MKINDLEKNSVYQHPTYGNVEFIRKEKENSKTMVIVKCIDRGVGWNDTYKRYVGVKTKNGWYLGKNRYFNQEFAVNVKELK
jgi:hypothetical protein